MHTPLKKERTPEKIAKESIYICICLLVGSSFIVSITHFVSIDVLLVSIRSTRNGSAKKKKSSFVVVVRLFVLSVEQCCHLQ